MEKAVFEGLVKRLRSSKGSYQEDAAFTIDGDVFHAFEMSRKLDAVCATDEERLLWLQGFDEAAKLIWDFDVEGRDRRDSMGVVHWLWAMVAESVLKGLVNKTGS